MVYDDRGRVVVPESVPDNAFWRADLLEAADLLVAVIRDRRPQVVVTYDPHGNYGHPDHIQAHRVTMYAMLLAASPSHRPDLGAPGRSSGCSGTRTTPRSGWRPTRSPRSVVSNRGPTRSATPTRSARTRARSWPSSRRSRGSTCVARHWTSTAARSTRTSRSGSSSGSSRNCPGPARRTSSATAVLSPGRRARHRPVRGPRPVRGLSRRTHRLNSMFPALPQPPFPSSRSSRSPDALMTPRRPRGQRPPRPAPHRGPDPWRWRDG
ncbi:PIG-L family deacetylase [Tessaracoccus coleopterorum]|uniref:PIG-L family deacetylase n=1 Tax=Tessaracoccus coleopterorum TaxID=2714950 RepID=UPI0022B221AE|nr:PIG-L family deacetylase [Tessaracoccus coleopterorum]